MLQFLHNLFRTQSSGTGNQFARFRRHRRKFRHRKKPGGTASSRPAFVRRRARRFKSPAQRGKPSWCFSQNPNRSTGGSSLRRDELVAWHGTPSLTNVKSILTYGWVVGNGNAVGDGVYTTSDFNVAKGYAGSGGYVLKLSLKPGRIANWSTSLQAAFAKWCAAHGCAPDMSAKTAFLLAQGFQTLQEGKIFVVLLRAYRNPLAAKIRTRRIRVIGAVRVSDGQHLNLHALSAS